MTDTFSDLKAQLPAELRDQIAGDTWEEVWIGWSGARIFRLDSGRYLKTAEPPHDLTHEWQVLDWLQGKLPVPEVHAWVDDFAAPRQYLLTAELPGLQSFDERFADQRAQIIDLLAAGLRQIHAIPIDNCPFDRQAAALIKQARLNVFEGRVDATRFDAKNQGRTAQSVLDEVIATRPAAEDFVFAHGDYCLPNILVDPATLTLTGFIDWGGAGIADRYLDLALVARSITYNFGAEWVEPFWAAYGVTDVDHAKVAFFQLLDELF